VLRDRGKRRVIGAVLIVLGAVLMWLAPRDTFGALSYAGISLLLSGIVIEIIGIALEHRDRRDGGRDRPL
jgi:drug/metabolite transporter (DMT)-like permease